MTTTPARVLVVDDERNIRKHLAMVLESAGYSVDVARDGEEAIELCRATPYAVAFVDVQMPKMGGLELLTRLRELSPDTVVVILTAYGTIARAVKAMKLGAVDFLEKPFDPNVVGLLVREILGRKGLSSAGSVDELLRLADLANQRSATVEARAYLKTALLRDATRPEPYYGLGALWECEGDTRQAVQFYLMALEANHTFESARTALARLGYLESTLPPS